MIYAGIDDTDTRHTPGTNQLARLLIRSVQPDYQSIVAVRHQLLFDSRVPYTRKNSAASMLWEPRDGGCVDDLAARLRREMLACFVEGSDPGLCVAEHVPPEVVEFGRRCQGQVVRQQDARRLAAAYNIYLEGLGGSEDGVIGALAAVGLVASGNDGRVVSIDHWPDDLAGLQDVSLLHARGIGEIRSADSDEIVLSGVVDVGKRLRPNYRDGGVVLFAQPTPRGWQAVRFP